jgi:putative peptidoglycan lipid II flippase
MTDPTAGAPTPPAGEASGAVRVGIGIFISRVSGVVREMVKASYLGATTTIAGDAFTAAFRIPNMLQNMLGEGALSASFIPVYSKLLAGKDRDEATRLAGAVAASLSLVAAIVVVIGVFTAPWLVRLIAWGFTGEKYELTVQLTRILFPGAALFVLSAWCLGILNSHGKLLLSYAAPVAWNATMIVAFLINGRTEDFPLIARTAAWGSLIGATLQFLVQLPVVLRLIGGLRLSIDRTNASLRLVLRSFAPVALSRGVVQVSAFVDQMISSSLPNGMVAILGSAQTVNSLPVSLFGIAVSAAALPKMSADVGRTHEITDEGKGLLRKRIAENSRNIAYYVIPSAVAFVLLGDTIFRLLFQRLQFLAVDTMYGWGILAASALGLLATTLARVYSSAFYAVHDTSRPVVFSLVRVTIGLSVGWALALKAPGLIGIDERWGAAGLGIAGGLAGWTEFALLRRSLQEKIGVIPRPTSYFVRLWVIALAAGGIAFALKRPMQEIGQVVEGVSVLGAFGLIYVASTAAIGLPEATQLLRRLRLRR